MIMSDDMDYIMAKPSNRSVPLKPNEEEKKLEWWVSTLEYLSKQQNVEERHTLQRRGILVSEPMSENLPKDVMVCEKLDKILELGMQEDGKCDVRKCRISGIPSLRMKRGFTWVKNELTMMSLEFCVDSSKSVKREGEGKKEIVGERGEEESEKSEKRRRVRKLECKNG
ncbi:hypothetical protein L1987_08564 [Smallanthus sonchifolius]|uniref:Uncharacterized protein n=1 Tax=Smallanthus sonchifolius TaxID=185202 RepID=A0ACB9JM39_9ASTR|nr:hypothetical protein L1987_08564 [Smallanthus sonchifolius]